MFRSPAQTWPVVPGRAPRTSTSVMGLAGLRNGAEKVGDGVDRRRPGEGGQP